MIRLDRWLVTLGLGSRSQVQKRIRAGEVTVDGRPVTDPGQPCPETAALALNGAALDSRLQRHVMLHKPAGILTAARDRRQPTVMDLLPASFAPLGCMPVGRLDKDTTGLLLLTTDGELAHRLLAPGRHVDKVYRAVVDGPLGERERQMFARGLDLGDFTSQPAEMEILACAADRAEARLTIHEGKFHQVKRMFEAVDRHVTELHRETFGPLRLDDGLAAGSWRDLTREELSALYQAAGMREAADE